jgi:hypothetical protein
MVTMSAMWGYPEMQNARGRVAGERENGKVVFR